MTAETTPKAKNKHSISDDHDHMDMWTTNRMDDAVMLPATELPVDPIVMLPTISSSIMKDRLSKYQRGQLGHLNWIVSQYLRPQEEHSSNQNISNPSSASSAKKRTRMVVDERPTNNDTNQQRPDEPSNDETNHDPATTASTRNNDTEDCKKARQILTQYVDRMRGGPR